MKYFLRISYKGTHYRGWQKQPNAPSIQEVLEANLARMIGKKVNLIGCGRTDAGVHAREFFGHIVIEKAFDFDPVFRINKMLPDDICVHEFIDAPRDIHAQHGAISRTYEYFIHFEKDPFLSEVSSLYSNENLNIELMKKAVKLISKSNDFRAFCKQPDLYKNTICKVSEATLILSENKKQLHFKISADRFLRGMIRILVGNILEIGYEKMSLIEFENCLKNGTRPTYFKEAYPQGLYLTKVDYPFLETI